jgi:hypothetical protein
VLGEDQREVRSTRELARTDIGRAWRTRQIESPVEVEAAKGVP